MGCRFPLAHRRLPVADCRLPVAACPAQHLVEPEQGQRQELHVQRLEVHQPCQQMGVEGVEHTRRYARQRAARPLPYDERHRPARERETDQDEEVVDGDRRDAGPDERCAHQRGHQHVLRVGQRVAVGEEDRRVKQGQGIAGNDMGDPRDHEDVEAHVVVVEPRQSAGIAGEGPGVQDGQRGEQREQPRSAANHRSPGVSA